MGTAEPHQYLTARIAAAVGTELSIHGRHTLPTVTIGIALFTDHSTIASLVRDTDFDLFHAKRSGRGHWQLYNDTMRSESGPVKTGLSPLRRWRPRRSA